jgi:circadian clock protein KaiB
MVRYLFRLFVAGRSSRSLQAISNLRRIGEERLQGRYELVVVDVLADPESAESARVLTTPTVVKESPGPARRVTGDLSDLDRVLFALDLDEEPPPASDPA